MFFIPLTIGLSCKIAAVIIRAKEVIVCQDFAVVGSACEAPGTAIIPIAVAVQLLALVGGGAATVGASALPMIAL